MDTGEVKIKLKFRWWFKYAYSLTLFYARTFNAQVNKKIVSFICHHGIKTEK